MAIYVVKPAKLGRTRESVTNDLTALHIPTETAEALAGELHQSLGEPLRIQEEHSGWQPWNVSWWGRHGFREYGQFSQTSIEMAGPSSVETTIAPGQIAVTARVSVEFALNSA